nr:vegetative cell wall protein gp1-like [Procambarus clarkii]
MVRPYTALPAEVASTIPRRSPLRDSWVRPAPQPPDITPPMGTLKPSGAILRPLRTLEPTRLRPRSLGSLEPSKPRPKSLGTLEPSGSRPQSMGTPEPSGSRPQSMGTPEPLGSRPQSMGTPEPSGSRPQSMGSPEPSEPIPQPLGTPEPSGSRPQSMGTPEPSGSRPQPLGTPEPSEPIPQPLTLNTSEPRQEPSVNLNPPDHKPLEALQPLGSTTSVSPGGDQRPRAPPRPASVILTTYIPDGGVLQELRGLSGQVSRAKAFFESSTTQPEDQPGPSPPEEDDISATAVTYRVKNPHRSPAQRRPRRYRNTISTFPRWAPSGQHAAIDDIKNDHRASSDLDEQGNIVSRPQCPGADDDDDDVVIRRVKPVVVRRRHGTIMAVVDSLSWDKVVDITGSGGEAAGVEGSTGIGGEGAGVEGSTGIGGEGAGVEGCGI